MELGREVLRQKLNLELENSVILSSANMIAGRGRVWEKEKKEWQVRK